MGFFSHILTVIPVSLRHCNILHVHSEAAFSILLRSTSFKKSWLQLKKALTFYSISYSM